jgi:hypothetical protein
MAVNSTARQASQVVYFRVADHPGVERFRSNLEALIAGNEHEQHFRNAGLSPSTEDALMKGRCKTIVDK